MTGFGLGSSTPACRARAHAVQQKIAKALIASGDDFRFDMSDQAPQAFGGTPGKGMWGTLQNFLKTGNVAATQHALESEANAAKGWC